MTVQAVCRVARDEAEVREVLDSLWKDPDRAEEILGEVRAENADIYRFEEMLEKGEPEPVKDSQNVE